MAFLSKKYDGDASYSGTEKINSLLNVCTYVFQIPARKSPLVATINLQTFNISNVPVREMECFITVKILIITAKRKKNVVLVIRTSRLINSVFQIFFSVSFLRGFFSQLEKENSADNEARGGSTWVNVCWVCASGLSETLPH